MNILEYIMAIYEKYFRFNSNKIFIYHDDSLSFKYKMIILCVFPELESNLYFCVCFFTFHSYWFCILSVLSYIWLCHSVYISKSLPAPCQSPTQFWCIASDDESQVKVKNVTKKKHLWALDSTKCIPFSFLFL